MEEVLAGTEDVVLKVDVEKPELVLDDVDVVDGMVAIELLDFEELVELVTIAVGSETVLDVVWLLEEIDDEAELSLN